MVTGLATQDIPRQLAEAVHSQTEGNPLFVQEVLRYLVEESLVAHQEGRWQRSGDEPVATRIM